jgi:hypothetical protein
VCGHTTDNVVHSSVPKDEERQPPQFATRPNNFSWVVRREKLQGSDKSIVSQSFQLLLGGQTERFKMKISAKAGADGDTKGSTNFEKSGGKGIVEVKCEESCPSVVVTYRIRVGCSDPRGPREHNFAENAWSGLAKTDELWDFSKSAGDDPSFIVLLEFEGFEKPMPICECRTPVKSECQPEESRITSMPTFTASPKLVFATPPKQQKPRRAKPQAGRGK